MTPSIGSICSGYGGLELAATEALGVAETAWHAEVDAAASRVLARHWPGVPNHGDITAVDWRAVEPVDVLCAGFPCQPISSAGRKGGDTDARWLWERPDGTGVLSAVRTLKPATVVLENVANLVTFQAGRLFHAILGDLQRHGYAVRWAVAGACAAHGCHHRHRVYVLARHVGQHAPSAVRVPVGTCGAPRGRRLLPSPAARDGDGRGEGSPEFWLRRMHDTGRVNGIPLGAAIALLPTPAARLASKWGSVSPETAANRMAARRRNLEDAVALLPSPAARLGVAGGIHPDTARSRVTTARGRNLDDVVALHPDGQEWGMYAEAVARWAAVHGAPPAPVEANTRGGTRLAAPFPEWMNGPPSRLGHRPLWTQRRPPTDR